MHDSLYDERAGPHSPTYIFLKAFLFMALWLKVIIVFGLAGLVLWLMRDSFRFAPFKPSTNKEIDRALELADVGPEDTVIDLGSGTGKAVLRAHQEFGASARGVELMKPLHWIACLRWWWAGRPEDVEFRQGDLFREDLEEVDVIYLYGTADALRDYIAPWLQAEAGPGTRVVSNRYPIRGMTPDRTQEGGFWSGTAYLYRL